MPEECPNCMQDNLERWMRLNDIQGFRVWRCMECGGMFARTSPHVWTDITDHNAVREQPRQPVREFKRA